ncbi:hypothetical protein PILCRDRAFT_558767 [Piloderma croceum F 1598]|uniref:MYND-type domain-containing protein n=1 Tax=Piloderma croceum (strain F 1598) TaxID=765440 RepID=A0A0C3BQA1_PILCF|nr:hypothetical protein PILCRDRAFT_558767 [Piloderma croceum F 1598]
MSDKAILASQKAQIRCCWVCYKSSADGFRISYCKNSRAASYCSTECQRGDWKNHKEMCRRSAEQLALSDMLGSAMNTDKFMEWYTAHRETMYWAIYHGLDIKTHPENISKQAVYFVLQERSPGPCAKADLPSAFFATSITIRERAWVQELCKVNNQPAEIFDSATACDVRAREGGDVGSALVVLELEHGLKFCPVRIAKGELELIPPKHERWREDVLNAFRSGSPIHLSFAGRNPKKSKRRERTKG